MGRVVNIQKYSVHDGPGIRDLVFMKGCPLRCIWCSNPETQLFNFQIGYNSKKCIGAESCGYCAKVCPEGAMYISDKSMIVVDRSKCVYCFKCVEVCCSKALHVFGSDMTVDEVFNKTQNQSDVWRANGGVTISGGEPLMQAEFVAALLKKYKGVGVHTAIETSGLAPWEKLEKVIPYCNLVYYDIKIMDSKKHKKYTGEDNFIILENIKKLTKTSSVVDIIIRTPVVPGINDQEEDIVDIARFLQTLPTIQDYELLPYHGYGSSKYEQLGINYELEGVSSLEKESVHKLNQRIRKMLNVEKTI